MEKFMPKATAVKEQNPDDMERTMAINQRRIIQGGVLFKPNNVYPIIAMNARHKRKENEMKLTSSSKRTTIFRLIILTAVSAILLTGLARIVFAATAKEIDASVAVAVDRFYSQVQGGKEFAKSAKGLLVMPNVTKAAIVVGGEYGEGALRIGGKNVAYYNLVSGSYGFQIGAQSRDMIIAFMTDEALKKFRSSAGWEAGVDGNIAVLDLGAGGKIDTTTIKDPIVAFVFDVKGLMADISLKGAKFTKLDMSK